MPCLSIADRLIESILLKERRVLSDSVEHKLVKIRKNTVFAGSKIVGEVSGSNYVSLHHESVTHMTTRLLHNLTHPCLKITSYMHH